MVKQEHKSVRLIDIANKLGISAAVVSKVLSGAGNANIRVSAEKAELIRKTAKQMHYTPNLNARVLAGQSVKLIGVLVDSQSPQVVFSLLSELEKLSSKKGYRLLVGEVHDNVDAIFSHYEELLQYGVDMVICLSHDYPGNNDKVSQYFKERKNILFVYGPEVASCRQIFVDVASGISYAVKYLHSIGKKNIALLTNEGENYSLHSRVRGFKQIAPKNETAIEDWIYYVPVTEDVNEQRKYLTNLWQKELSQRHCDAIIAKNDEQALVLMGVLLKLQIKIPEQVAIIGYDNDRFSCRCTPALTTIDQGNCEIARQIMEQIFNNENICQIYIEPKLVIRETT